MPSHYNMKMLPAKGTAPTTGTADSSINPPQRVFGDGATNTTSGNSTFGENLTTGQKKLIAFAAGIAIGMFLKRKK